MRGACYCNIEFGKIRVWLSTDQVHPSRVSIESKIKILKKFYLQSVSFDLLKDLFVKVNNVL